MAVDPIKERHICEVVFPALVAERHKWLLRGRNPTGVTIPAYLNPGEYDGDDAEPNQPAMIMGLPITWGGDRLELTEDR